MGNYLANIPSDDIIQYYYFANDRMLLDECGDVVSNHFTIFSPLVMYVLRNKKENMFAFTRAGEYVEILYEESYSYIYGDYDIPIDKNYRRY